jgi:hypothetical protein
VTVSAPSDIVDAAASALATAEVGHERLAARQEHVVRLDVAVDEPLLVGVRECGGHVAQHANSLAHRQLAAPLQSGPQRVALDERHAVVEQLAGSARSEQGHDVRVTEPRGDADFLPEAIGRQRVRQG